MKINLKKQHLLLAIFFISINLVAQKFTKVKGKATDIAISPKDGSIYIVGTSKNVFKYDTGAKKFKSFGEQTKNVRNINITKRKMYMISLQNTVHKNNNGFWEEIPGIKAKSLLISSNVGVLNLKNELYNAFRTRSGNVIKTIWISNGINNLSKKNKQIIQGNDKTYYLRANDNSFQKYVASTNRRKKVGKLTNLRGKPLYITVDKVKNTIYAVGRNRGIYKWNVTKQDWSFLDGTKNNFKRIAVNNGEIWGITTDNSIYYYDKDKAKKDTDYKKYSGTYKVTYEDIYTSKDAKLYGNIGVYLEAKTKSGNITIKPLDNKRNRMWEVVKESPQLANKSGRRITEFLSYKGIEKRTDQWQASIEIDKVREFKLIGEAANKDATFDFQIHVKKEVLLGRDFGGWERVKLKISDLVLNKKYFFYHIGTDTAISFKIEKI